MTEKEVVHQTEAVYNAVYGDIGDHRLHDEKVTAIHQWLLRDAHTDGTESIDQLAARWREHESS
jgi:hypothetical protein